MVVNEQYKKIVLDDLATYVGLSHPVKTGVLERFFTRTAPLTKLHPNPEDEFSMPDIGPNFGIVNDYAEAFRSGAEKAKEPVVVEKMSTGGYMLLNGHHRWFAAHYTKMKSMKVELVNVVTDEEILTSIRESKNHICVSFDLDEVLLTDGADCPVDRKLIFPLDRLYKKTFRKNAPVLINELREMGVDVWAYTGQFVSDEYLKFLCQIHHTAFDGIVNGLIKKKSKKVLRQAFSDKYDISLHIDQSSVVCVYPKSKEYDIYEIPEESRKDANWAVEVVKILKGIDFSVIK